MQLCSYLFLADLFGGCYDTHPIGPTVTAQTSALFRQAALDLSAQIRSLQMIRRPS